MAITSVGAYGLQPGTTSVTMVPPGGSAAGDRAIIALASKLSGTTPGTPTGGFTLIGSAVVGTGADGAGTGPILLSFWYLDLAGAAGNSTITVTGGNVINGGGHIFRKGAGESWSTPPTVLFGSDTTSGTPFAAVASAQDGYTVGDVDYSFAAITRTGVTLSARTMAVPGCTITVTGIDSGGTANGNDLFVWSDRSLVTAGSQSGAASTTATLSLASTGGAGHVRIALSSGTSATVTPAVVSAVAAVPAPTMQTGQTAAPATVTATAGVPAPTTRAGSIVTPTTISAVAVVPAPTVRLSVALVAVTVAAVTAVGVPTLQAGTTASPGAVGAVAAVPAPTVHAGAVVAGAATVAATAAVPAPAVSAGGSALIAAVAVHAVTTVPAPTLQAGAIVAPGAVQALAAVPASTLQAGGRPIPAVVTATAAVPSSTVQAGARPAPSVVTAVAGVPGVTVQVSRTVTAVTVAAVASIPTPGLSILIRPTVVTAIAAVPAPTVLTLAAYTPVTEPLRARSRALTATSASQPVGAPTGSHNGTNQTRGISRVIPRATATTRET